MDKEQEDKEQEKNKKMPSLKEIAIAWQRVTVSANMLGLVNTMDVPQEKEKLKVYYDVLHLVASNHMHVAIEMDELFRWDQKTTGNEAISE